MKDLARLTAQGRRGQIAALAATLIFSATLISALGLLFETGVRGQVTTGEYARAPHLLGAPQSLPASGDVAVAIPGRALLRDDLVDAIVREMPSARVIVDRIVPATFAGSTGEGVAVTAHPWSALALGDRSLVAGTAPEEPGDLVVPQHFAWEQGIGVGDEAHIAFGGPARGYTVVGFTDAHDVGADVPDIHFSDRHLPTPAARSDQVAAVGVWPSDGGGAGASAQLAELAEAHGARLWSPGNRGQLEVVRQGQAKATLTSAAGAFGALAFIITTFMVMALTSLQIRERSRELAMLRIVGATPEQVEQLALSEVRRVAVFAGVVGGIIGPVLGGAVVAVGRSSDVLPARLEPVVSPLPSLIALLVGLVVAEIAVRISMRRVVGRGSPLHGLSGSDQGSSRWRQAPRVVAGSLVLGAGVAMACAPWYVSGEAATGLAGLSALVMALSIGLLSPLVVLAAARVVRRRVQQPAWRYLAHSSVRTRATRVGSMLATIVLGVALTSSQVFAGATSDAITEDQIRAGNRADLVVTSTLTGIDQDTARSIAEVAGVDSVDPMVTSTVVARGEGDDSTWQTLPGLGATSDGLQRYADLDVEDDALLSLGPDDVALGVQGANAIDSKVGDTITVVLADGRTLHRTVRATYRRGMGFGEVLLPLDDLRAATASGLPTALVVTASAQAPLPEVAARIDERLDAHPGAQISRGPTLEDPAGPSDEASLQVFLLVIVWGFIAIAVVNSLVVATLSRRSELALLHAVGATPLQRRRVGRWEALFLAGTGCIVGTLVATPGAVGLTYSLSNGERIVPAVAPAAMAVIVAFTFTLVLGASALAGRSTMRAQ